MSEGYTADYVRKKGAGPISEEMANLQSKLDVARSEYRDLQGRITAIVHVAGGIVEGRPTGSHNILQRIRELRRIEDPAYTGL